MHNMKDDDGNKDLDDEVNNDFQCLFQLPIEIGDLSTLATNEVQKYNQVYMLKQMWFC